jgi:hypothetical protein
MLGTILGTVAKWPSKSLGITWHYFRVTRHYSALLGIAWHYCRVTWQLLPSHLATIAESLGTSAESLGTARHRKNRIFRDLAVLGTEVHKAGSVIHGREQTRLVTSCDVTLDLMLICKAIRQDFCTMVL